MRRHIGVTIRHIQCSKMAHLNAIPWVRCIHADVATCPHATGCWSNTTIAGTANLLTWVLGVPSANAVARTPPINAWARPVHPHTVRCDNTCSRVHPYATRWHARMRQDGTLARTRQPPASDKTVYLYAGTERGGAPMSRDGTPAFNETAAPARDEPACPARWLLACPAR
ncbi:hypothetical protein BD779DRAFT_1550689 [Infundibulicybe gibba]|nr:hypothetical protein BD779DRAFT_1550689 [Infundibulicybe gibba]